MKRTLSLILSLLMVLSLFTGLNVGAGARVSDLAGTGESQKSQRSQPQVTQAAHAVPVHIILQPKQAR